MKACSKLTKCKRLWTHVQKWSRGCESTFKTDKEAVKARSKLSKRLYKHALNCPRGCKSTFKYGQRLWKHVQNWARGCERHDQNWPRGYESRSKLAKRLQKHVQNYSGGYEINFDNPWVGLSWFKYVLFEQWTHMISCEDKQNIKWDFNESYLQLIEFISPKVMPSALLSANLLTHA